MCGVHLRRTPHRPDAFSGVQVSKPQHSLDFIPLFEERYDLILPHEQEKFFNPLLEYIQTLDFRNLLNSLTGYNTKYSGEQILL